MNFRKWPLLVLALCCAGLDAFAQDVKARHRYAE